jgi:hypothetical protein
VDDDLVDVPVCTWPGGVEYRPLPGWPRYRVGSNRAVWVNDTPAGRPPPWDQPSWRRVKVRAGRVRLQRDGREHERSAELLYRAVFDPGSLSADEMARAGPDRPPAKRPREIIVPPGVPAPPAIATAELHGATERDITAIVAQPIPAIDDDDERNGRARGSAHGRAVLTEELVIEVRRLKAEGVSYPALVRRFGVGKVTLFYAISGRTWSHIPMNDHSPPLPTGD